MNAGGVSVASVVGVMVIAWMYQHRSSTELTPLERKRLLAMTIRTCGAVLWPAVLLAMVPRADRNHPALAIPLLFQGGVWALDGFFITSAPCKHSDTPASLRFEAAGLAGLSFGLCSLLGNKPDSTYTPLFLYAILGCLIVVLPSHNLAAGCVHEQVFESVQKTALTWCLGLLIAAVALTRCHACASATSVRSGL